MSVVLPEDSGPKTSTMRPRGTPPMPSARSSESAPVGIASTAHLGALVAHPHDRALAELALDLRERALKGGVTRLGGLFFFCHAHRQAPVGRWFG